MNKQWDYWVVSKYIKSYNRLTSDPSLLRALYYSEREGYDVLYLVILKNHIIREFRAGRGSDHFKKQTCTELEQFCEEWIEIPLC